MDMEPPWKNADNADTPWKSVYRVSRRPDMDFRLKGSDSDFPWAGEQETMFIETDPSSILRML